MAKIISNCFPKTIDILEYRKSLLVNEDLIQKISTVISETKESYISLEKNSIKYMNDPDNEKENVIRSCQRLMRTCSKILNLRPEIEKELGHTMLSVNDVMNSTNDFLQLSMEEHFNSSNVNVTSITQDINMIAISLSSLTNMASKRSVQFLQQVSTISEFVTGIYEKLKSISDTLESSSLIKVPVSRYIEHIDNLIASIELTSTTYLFSIVFEEYQHLSFQYFIGELIHILPSVLGLLSKHT